MVKEDRDRQGVGRENEKEKGSESDLEWYVAGKGGEEREEEAGKCGEWGVQELVVREEEGDGAERQDERGREGRGGSRAGLGETDRGGGERVGERALGRVVVEGEGRGGRKGGRC